MSDYLLEFSCIFLELNRGTWSYLPPSVTIQEGTGVVDLLSEGREDDEIDLSSHGDDWDTGERDENKDRLWWGQQVGGILLQ